ncbi:Riboflavin transporter 2 [Schistosoma japonicum]|uniref:Riboflavin transporter n=1 Tax=Schistosoma japonicum TaxID=6182 RepID=A0A4Z2DU36_SCHJA|nr:Solute carrier family 52, riboflavin transporter, member 3-B [Schistosoma japonicum]KAH8867355.1 Solute carrier family 52, riboflavin transporter, member 3-B [Schistosoma japonicum]KAH8867356.1 Solute carrier family 52, riboflavin transporter, member 3-B [Schistosoma japonicum]KAH8867357.1 Solute carrier family 52, riboflavin transporter, member 3-B [Schistosoma japonicum]KAH8867358.1 Solute carrier family 52, riboflavin transporter, member 3-B [Schistosoma japonicum]
MVASRNGMKFTWFAACLVSLYGLGSWIIVNGLWVELPLLVNVLPEGWSLPAYLIIIIQIANVGPAIYVPLTKAFQAKANTFFSRCLQPPERMANYLILIIGLISCILISQFWKSVVYIPSLTTGYHSVGLFSLALFASIVDCTSSVTFITYLNGMPQLYVGALHFGEAFSDLVPSVLALIQGVGSDPECVTETVNGTLRIVQIFPPPRFSVSTFIYLLCVVLMLSLTAFILLDCSSIGLGRAVHEHYRKSNFILESNDVHTSNKSQNNLERVNSNHENQIANGIIKNTENVLNQNDQTVQLHSDIVSVTNHSGPSTFISCFLISYISASNYGFLPSIQSYSCAAYGSLTYHLAVTLSGLFSAITTVLTTFLVNHYSKMIEIEDESAFKGSKEQNQIYFRQKTDIVLKKSYMRSLYSKWISITLISLMPVAYVIYLASSSPNPPHLSGFGSASAILAWIAIRCLFASLRTWIWMILSSHSNRPMRLRLAGLSTQFGAALGAILGFLLVVYFQLFKSKTPCLQA